ncbi:Flavonol 3-sulfotransferase [Handroanthus impetiginosus]|uniref:Sulfotransferase n=1 Tax=Handroanthus impetiginosus TaxID=429701 RepID=A0A2G9H117_9LAMI|nr:Flavonol 3-sulfotransferase [Handroanthus impetiginosus]
MNHPRLFSTHLAHQVLPNSLTNSKSKIVYVYRNLLDRFISDRKFFLKTNQEPDFEPLPVEEAFDMFCKGIHSFGPFWEHILGYWKASLENPDRVLFLKYEDVKSDPISSAVKIAEFVGMPFSEEEEKRGLIGEISELCSFEKMKNWEVNKRGIHRGSIENSSFFRKGEIGDWKNHLSPEMAERLQQIMDEKMSECGLML